MALRSFMALSFAAGMLQLAAAAAQENNVLRTLAPKQVEGILRGLDIDFQKRPLPGAKTVLAYSFARNKYKVALHYYDGKELMLIASFDALPLNAVNEWNKMSKFSRAILNEEDAGTHSTIEANLDLAGGVTEEAIKHFIRRFEQDLKKYDGYVGDSQVREEETFKAISATRLEKILTDLNVAYKKGAGRGAGHVYYEFEKNKHKVRLHSFNGTDLMLAAAFKKSSLEKVNEYNTEKKFLRAVLYEPANSPPFSTLESNLDCQGGVTDSIVRFFIGVFDDEMREFEKYLK